MGRAASFGNMETPPDANFSSSDVAALGAIQKIKGRVGLKIPEDNLRCRFFPMSPLHDYGTLRTISTVDQCPWRWEGPAPRFLGRRKQY